MSEDTAHDGTRSLEALERIDSLCVDFEDELRAGRTPKIEEMLEQAPTGERDYLLRELLALELEHRFANRDPSPDEYYERFPEDRRLIDAACERIKEHRQPALESLPTAAENIEAEGVGTVVGRYKLLQEIGEGGMGTVYMAEQQEPVRRKVALKIIKPGMDSREVIARFEAERQALAMMEHHNIAKVLDAGTTDNGRPFFVMELVRGVPITKYCDDNRLTVAERLELFLPTCQAIQHAHQKGIIHRDIKPSNVLVCSYDGDPVPKVIDFGIAKAIQQRLTEKTLFTQFGQMLGTPLYMSPEQAEMSQLDIDTRSDIYSLGVLLYELLTGSTPITREQLHAAGWEGMMRLIREQEPPKPSTRLSSSGEALPSISAQRHTEPKKLGMLVRGDLDWIVMKSLEKDRTRRYATVNGFARDIQRHLDDEPVEACPPSLAYKTRKFIRKHRVGVSVATVFALILVGVVLVGLGIRQAVVADRERIQVEHAQKIAAQKLENDRKRAQSLVEGVLTGRAAGVPYAIAALERLHEHAVPILQSKCDAENIGPIQRLHAACALAQFNDVRLRVLLDSIQHAPSDEVANIVTALRHSQADAVRQLKGIFEVDRDTAYRVRLAIVLLHLGDTSAAQAMLALGPDPTERTAFIHGLEQWHGDLSDYAQSMRATSDPDFRSGLCLGIGRIPVDRLAPIEKHEMEQVLLSLYHTAPGGSTHSSCDWALRQWNPREPIHISGFAGWASSWGPDSQRLVHQIGERGRPYHDRPSPEGTLKIVDVQTQARTDLGIKGRDPAWCPKAGGPIAFVTRNDQDVDEIWLVETDGGNARKLTDGDLPSWSADGGKLYFTHPPTQTIRWVDVARPEAEAMKLIDCSWPYPAVSPDGTMVALGQDGKLVVIRVADEQQVCSWDLIGWRGLRVGWSPDSSTVGFGCVGSGHFHGLWLLDIETAEAHRVMWGSFTTPRWSADGTSLAFYDLLTKETCVVDVARLTRNATDPLTTLIKRTPIEANPIQSGAMGWYVNALDMTMIKIPAGRFDREYSTFRRRFSDPDAPTVTLTKAFWISNREVSVDQFRPFWDSMLGEEKRFNWQGRIGAWGYGGEHPASYVSASDAMRYCNWLSDQESLTRCYEWVERKKVYGKGVHYIWEWDEWRFVADANGYRLPTEAEWEYSCRAQTTTDYCFGDQDTLLNQYAVYAANETQPCGSKLPNGWGLFDMHGNLEEWCWDVYGNIDNNEDARDPLGPPSGGIARVSRGGGFEVTSLRVRSAVRTDQDSDNRTFGLGFRVARTYP